MRRARIALGSIVVLALAAGTLIWTQFWSPFSRALALADVESGRDQARVTTSWRGLPERLWLKVRGMSLGDHLVDRQRWATGELVQLALHHPQAIARAAEVEVDPQVRCLLLSTIVESNAFATLPESLRYEEVVSDVGVARFDAGLPMTMAQKEALLANRLRARDRLGALLRSGHCGALVGYAVLGQKPAQEDLFAAARPIADGFRETKDCRGFPVP